MFAIQTKIGAFLSVYNWKSGGVPVKTLVHSGHRRVRLETHKSFESPG
jgi:hypothetical protein